MTRSHSIRYAAPLAPPSRGVLPGATTGAPTRLPGDLPASAVPWGRVGPGWLVGIWSTTVDPTVVAPATLYLVDPVGTRYAIAAASTAYRLLDVTADGRRALGRDETTTLEWDLTTGAVRQLGGLPTDAEVRYTRPAGAALLVASGPHLEVLEQRSLDGALQLRLAGHPASETSWSPPLPLADGSGHLVETADDIALLDARRPRIAGTFHPPIGFHHCAPISLWPNGFLARCETTTGTTDLFSYRLEAPDPTRVTRGAEAGGGFTRAWRWSGGILAEPFGACGAGPIGRLAADARSTAPLALGLPQSPESGYPGPLAVVDDRLVVTTLDCSGPAGSHRLAVWSLDLTAPAPATPRPLLGGPLTEGTVTAVLVLDPTR